MLKVVVYDSGWGEECVANYLRKELPIMEVEQVGRRNAIWYDRPEEWNGREAILEAIRVLTPYIGKCDAIVLGGYASSLMIEVLRREFPGQNFVGMAVDFEKIFHSRMMPSNVGVLVNPIIAESELMNDLQMNLAGANLVVPDTLGWDELLDDDMLSKRILRSTLAKHFIIQKPITYASRRQTTRKVRLMHYTKTTPVSSALSREKIIRAAVENLERLSRIVAEDEAREGEMGQDNGMTVEAANMDWNYIMQRNVSARDGREMWQYDEFSRPIRERTRLVPVRADVILLLDTHLWGIRAELEEIFGWRTRVIDFRKRLLADVYAAVGLKGGYYQRK